jgi:hypothetical protein
MVYGMVLWVFLDGISNIWGESIPNLLCVVGEK